MCAGKSSATTTTNPSSQTQPVPTTASSSGATTTPDPSTGHFLGALTEICVVSRDYKRTIASLSAMGIGPWKCYAVTPSNTTNQTYRGQPSAYSLQVCLAEVPNSRLMWEIIQPLSGPNIFDEFLESHGEGIHHVAHDLNNLPWEERIAAFEARGFKMVQSGWWLGVNKFAFFETEGIKGAWFETIEFPEDFDFPDADEEFPLTTR